MPFDPRFILALAILVAVSGVVVRGLLNTWLGRREGSGSAGERLARLEERITRIEDATSDLVAEFAAVRERERFMTQLVESRARKDARALAESGSAVPAVAPATGSEPSPFVVQTVSAVRRSAHRGNTG
ncbi:MAG: emp24/gp25L/p24 family protein [Gemmatimonadota bacterium]|nr:emp24/gp25L/p24 family protein [Gemmatimonadota bacterium]